MTGICNLQDLLKVATKNVKHGVFMGHKRSQKSASNRSLSGLEPAEEGALLDALGRIDERNERIQRLKAKIEAGRYFVASGEVAERLMAAMMAD